MTPVTFVVLVILNSLTYSNSSPPNPSVTASVKVAMEYFNNTLHLADRVEMVEQYYDLEREEGYFLIARLRTIPPKMEEIFSNLEALEYEAKHKNPRDKKILKKIKEIDEELSYNFGARKANFRIRREDPIIENMRAATRMEKHWEGLMEEFRNYAKSQKEFFESYSSILDAGIELAPSAQSQILLLVDEETAQDFLDKYPKSENFEEANFDDIYEKLNVESKGTPIQTSQEIRALQSFLAGEVIDPYSQVMLKGFIPDLNQKSLLIIGKMRELEDTINTLNEQSQSYAQYLLRTRNEMHETIDELKIRFDFEPDYKDEL